MSKTFTVILRQLVVPAGESEVRLPARAARRLGCAPEDILSCRPVRRSLDARKRRGKAVAVYHLRLELPLRLRRDLRKRRDPDIVLEKPEQPGIALADPGPTSGRPRPLVVGAGPAGLFAALRLARAGWKPLLVERGDDIEARRIVAADFWRRGVLDPESNPLFGVGGAGLFSDGKLNTRHKDRDGLRTILGAMVEAGAPDSIMVDAEPHVGSDRLGDVVARLLREIRDLGGEIRCRTKMTGLAVEDGALRAVRLAESDGHEEAVATDACVLAVGHSARDVYCMLHNDGFALEAKPFAVGVRVEMPQEQIDASQRSGKFKPSPGAAASFRMSRPPEGGARACYTFCMCPGGMVIACASEPGRLAVNGMSYHARAGDWGNAAFLSPVTAEDFALFKDEPAALRGMAFQRFWEEASFAAGGTAGAYAIPASSLADFVAGRQGELPERRGVDRAAAANLRSLLPEGISSSLAAAIPAMLSRLRRVDMDTVTVYATETRTSSPVRISRDANGESITTRGVFPAGEGSGYAGGIMTSALDGWNAAGRIMCCSRRA